MMSRSYNIMFLFISCNNYISSLSGRGYLRKLDPVTWFSMTHLLTSRGAGMGRGNTLAPYPPWVAQCLLIKSAWISWINIHAAWMLFAKLIFIILSCSLGRIFINLRYNLLSMFKCINVHICNYMYICIYIYIK